ncbi:hypothetical protein SFRURICE_004106 [Spodoptera frugiperda]|nr:hypothetical protein SFRURICE_004106 [Spodoptera frugiperda]
MSSYVKWTFEYTKLRKNFGREPLFQMVPATMLDSIYPNKEDQKQYMLRNPVHREVQATYCASENTTNTPLLKTHEQSVNHTEGGWPREVNPYNEDHVQRHRRRIMHEDNYIQSVQNLSTSLFHCIDQNNAIEMQTKPVYVLKPEYPCWQLACSPSNPELLVCGLEKGIVNVFDVRVGEAAVSSSSVYNSHREGVTSLLFIHSRTQSEFFTGSSDGQCLWWDLRNLSHPLDQLPMSVRYRASEKPGLNNAEGVSALEFDHGLPTKFLCGTETGLVINANRMGRSHSDILVSYWNAHDGSIQAVERSPCTFRMFLTCGDYTVKVWSEEVRTEPIIVARPYNHLVSDAAWAPLRFSSYMSICSGGFFYYWDLLRKYKEPVMTLHVSKHGLTRLSPHSGGESVAIGDCKGSVYLLHLSENMSIPGNRDKVLMSQVYERETKREHILDNRVKEIRLKARAEEEGLANEIPEEITDEEELDQMTQEEYFRIVEEELKNMDVNSDQEGG